MTAPLATPPAYIASSEGSNYQGPSALQIGSILDPDLVVKDVRLTSPSKHLLEVLEPLFLFTFTMDASSAHARWTLETRSYLAVGSELETGWTAAPAALVQVDPLAFWKSEGDARALADRTRKSVLEAPSQLDEELATTDDQGLVLEYTSNNTDKELTIVIPADGHIRYFVAKGRGVRYAGVVREDEAVARLARWIADQASPFPASGLEIGRSS
jgi:hypothetical protein